MKKFIGLYILMSLMAMAASAQDFAFVTGPENIISSKATLGMPGLAGNPRAIIAVTPSEETARANTHPIGVWYYNGKWSIFNTDHAVMAPNLVYKVHVFRDPGPNQFLHIVSRDNLSEGASYIDNPVVNNNPNAAIKILQNYAPDDRAPYNLNANAAEAKYNESSGRWYIANINGRPLIPNTAYNVVVSSQTVATPKLAVHIPELTIKATVADQPAQPAPLTSQPAPPGPGRCTNEMAQETLGKWAPQKADDLAMADRTFPKIGYRSVLAKAQEVIELFKIANPDFKGIEAHAYRGIRGDPLVPNGPVPFRVDVRYGSYICIGNDTYKVDMRGKVIVHGNYGVTTVSFNSLRDILRSVQDGAPLKTADGEEIFQYNKDLGDFKGYPYIETSHTDSYHEAIIVAANDRLPYKPVTREQYIRARIQAIQQSGGMSDSIATLNRALENMSPAQRQSPALVRDLTTTSKLFATEAEGGRHLVTIDKSYFNPKLPRDKIQLITVHWHSSPSDPADRPKIEMLRVFKENFDFIALWEMLDNQN